MSQQAADLPEGITNARKALTFLMVSFDRPVNPEIVLGLASHFSNWNYGPGLEYGQGGEVLPLTGGDGLQLRVGTYGKPSQVCTENFRSATPSTEDYLFIGSRNMVSIQRHERVAGDTFDRYISEIAP